MSTVLYGLTILWITLKRIVRNWRLIAALLAGLMLASGIMSAVPIYTSASLQKSFLRSWVEVDKSRPPFAVITTHDNNRRRFDIGPERIDRFAAFVEKELPRTVRIQPAVFATFGRIGADPILRAADTEPSFLSPTADLVFLSNLVSLSDVIVGRWYEPRDDGVVEIVADESTLRRLELVVGERYVFHYTAYESESASTGARYVPVQVELVGMFRPKAGTTTRDWIYPPPFSRRIFVEPGVFRNTLQGEMQLRVDDYDFLTVFPFEEVRVDKIHSLSLALTAFEARAARIAPEAILWKSPIAFFDSFNLLMRSISLFLIALTIPTFGMVLYYVVLMAGVAVDNRRSEMTVLQSRGAGRFQIMSSFFIEWALLGIVALLAAPFIGLIISLIMGSTADFLGFVNRSALPAAINMRSIVYGLVAAAAAVGAATVPVFSTFRHSIVTLRAQQSRALRRTGWHRFILDFTLIGLAIFGHRALSWEQVALSPDATIAADPILFFVPVIGLLGVGLLILRIYPLVVSGLSRATGRFRGVVLQLVLRRLHRNASQYVPILLLLVLTVSLGMYTATTARTLSKNIEDQINYHVGADIVIDEQWQDNSPPVPGAPPPPPLGEVTAEPPLLVREEIEGVNAVARVLRGAARFSVGNIGFEATHLMAIAPWEFARVAWYRDDLFEAPFIEYLNLLNRHNAGVIVSRSVFNNPDVDLGTTVTLDFDGERFNAYVIAVVDYWPGINPLERSNRRFMIANLPFIQDQTRLRPYFGWYRVDDDLDVQVLVNKLSRQSIFPQNVVDARDEIITLRREPYRMGFFGILSMGFLVSAAVTALGFLIYTFYSVRSRLIQFGALRANGLSVRQLIAVVGFEQLMSLGTGLGVGYGLGRAATAIFIPFLRDRAAELRQVPPFVIVTQNSDINIIFAVIAVVFISIVLGLSVFLLRKRLFSSLKLGEEV